MKWRLQIPSKTFILGEYAVLEGGPCLGAATGPCFEMAFMPSCSEESSFQGIHPDSPAGNFYSEHKDAFKKVDAHFFDPLQGMGGFGASTAQYLGLWTFREMILKNRSREELSQSESLKEMIREYRHFSSRKSGRMPSGADVIMQFFGDLIWIDSTSWEVQKVSWPWPDLIGLFISTGNKVATHAHLQDLSDFNPSELFRILQQARVAIKSKDADLWFESIHDYYRALDLLGLVAPQTEAQLKQLRQWPGVKAVKGCGAMGADVIFCVLESQSQSVFQELVVKNNLKIVASVKDMFPGLKIIKEDIQKNHERSHD